MHRAPKIKKHGEAGRRTAADISPGWCKYKTMLIWTLPHPPLPPPPTYSWDHRGSERFGEHPAVARVMKAELEGRALF